MIKIESITLEEAYTEAATSFKCSITELTVEVVQAPTNGFFGLFKKNAIIVAAKKSLESDVNKSKIESEAKPQQKVQEKKVQKVKEEVNTSSHTILNDTIMPASFINDQDDDDDMGHGLEYTADYDDEFDEFEAPVEEETTNLKTLSTEVQNDINKLFNLTCFNIDDIVVKPYDEETLLIEFSGEDAALLIGKEGYRYKALSYMIFNWINSKYEVQLRLEIAEFLKNQEESVSRYLVNVCENIQRDGRAQTKILDGVLVQIALKELRERYPEKYVVIRSTKDGLKYIIVNDYHNN